jgi:hypothetical protein
MFIYDTLLTMTLKKNILLVGNTMEKNYKLLFDIKECWIMDKLNMNVVVVREEKTTYTFFKLTFSSSHIIKYFFDRDI